MNKWEKTTIDAVSELVTAGGTPYRKEQSYWKNGDIPWLKISDLKSKYIYGAEEKITRNGLENSSTKIYPKGTVLFSIFATIGASGIIKNECASNQAIAGIVPNKNKIDSEYLYYLLKSERDKLFEKKSHATQDNINLSTLRNHEILLPPLKTQEKIVSVLEKIEELKEKRKEANKLTDEYLNSIFLEILNNKKYAEKKLKDVCINKGEYGSGASAIKFDQNTRYVRITDIDAFGNLKKTGLVSPSVVDGKYFLKKGDVLFARTGATVGKTYLHNNDEKHLFAGYLIRFTPNKNIVSPEFIFYFTKLKKYKSWVKSKMKVVAQPNINAKQYGEEILIPLLPIEIQNKFSKVVKKIEKIKINQKQSEKELDNLFNSLMQKAFKGELLV